MKVKLLTSVSSAEGSWATGVRDIPDELAEELLAAGLAEPAAGDDAAKVKKPRAVKE